MLIVVFAFVLTVKSGQYDDMEGDANRIQLRPHEVALEAHYKPP